MDEAIARYFQEVYSGGDQQEETEEDIAMWSRLEAVVDATQGMFTT